MGEVRVVRLRIGVRSECSYVEPLLSDGYEDDSKISFQTADLSKDDRELCIGRLSRQRGILQGKIYGRNVRFLESVSDYVINGMNVWCHVGM